MDRVFLDANVLFSAAYRPDAGLLRLWELDDTELITSRYALEEAQVNLPEPGQRRRLEALVSSVTLVDEALDAQLPSGVELPDKDRPILAAALAARAAYLVTGDLTHFGALMDRPIRGLHVLTPAAMLQRSDARSGSAGTSA